MNNIIIGWAIFEKSSNELYTYPNSSKALETAVFLTEKDAKISYADFCDEVGISVDNNQYELRKIKINY